MENYFSLDGIREIARIFVSVIDNASTLDKLEVMLSSTDDNQVSVINDGRYRKIIYQL